MTEDETFLVLRRPPVQDMMHMRNELFWKLGSDNYDDQERNERIKQLTIDHGWTEKEYYRALGPPYAEIITN